jgi:SAM-dependent methyltransferase
MLMLRHRGHDVWCPVCGHRFRRFKDDWNRPDALCWRCGSHERHRALWLLFEQRPELLSSRRALLHFAPEHCLRRQLARAAAHHGFRYDTGDLDPAGVDLRLEITALELPDDAYDAVLCSHVLEHVPDDAAAISELRRVTAADGWCLVMVPIDLDRAATYEDPAITTSEQRLAAYWQADHVRLYGRDVADRLSDAGFTVEVVRPPEAFGEEPMRRARLLPSDWMMLCR